MSHKKPAPYIPMDLMKENFHDDHSLPPLWQVIYQEAIRANHIIFEKQDVECFESDRSHEPICEHKIDFQDLSNIMISLFSSPDLGEITKKISSLPYRRKKQVYKIYRRFIESFRYQYKQSLN